MKVFLSWSGERSRLVAELLNEWIKCVIQSVEPWFSPQDIQRGSIWFTAIADQLADVTTGIVCLTRENHERPWILFEAGALTKGISENRVITLLIDLENNELSNSPLASFNHSSINKEGMFTLLTTINARIEKPLDLNTLKSVFDLFWPQFENRFKDIIASTENQDAKPIVENVATQNDIQSLVRSVNDLQTLVYRKFGNDDFQTNNMATRFDNKFPISLKRNKSAVNVTTDMLEQLKQKFGKFEVVNPGEVPDHDESQF